jgi:hypothetical protein
MYITRVWISFSRLTKLASWIQHFHSPSQKTTGQKYRKGLSEREKTLARLASGFVYLLANPEFHSHLASGYPHPWYLCCFIIWVVPALWGMLRTDVSMVASGSDCIGCKLLVHMSQIWTGWWVENKSLVFTTALLFQAYWHSPHYPDSGWLAQRTAAYWHHVWSKSGTLLLVLVSIVFFVGCIH